MSFEIQRITPLDREAIGAAVKEHWGEEKIIVHEETFHTADLPGLQAVEKNELLGFMHYQIRDELCEIITLASLRQKQGVGTALLKAIEAIARTHGCKRLIATTTNDNLGALVFYQRCGFMIASVGLGLVDEARKLKPSIPEIGHHAIPIHDEIYLERHLNDI